MEKSSYPSSFLKASTPEGTDIREWSSVSYNCSDPNKKVYLEGVEVSYVANPA